MLLCIRGVRGSRVRDQGVEGAGKRVQVGADYEGGFGRGEDEDDAAKGAERGEGVDGVGTVALEGGADYGEVVWCENGGVIEILEDGVRTEECCCSVAKSDLLLSGVYSRAVRAGSKLGGLIDQEIMLGSGGLWRFGWRIVRLAVC